MSELAKKKCVPCTVETQALKGAELLKLFRQLPEDWELISEKNIEKTYKFKDFRQALAFVCDVGAIAEEEGHHPDIELSWGKVKVIFSTHKIQGLTASDFVMAAKSEVAYISRVK